MILFQCHCSISPAVCFIPKHKTQLLWELPGPRHCIEEASFSTKSGLRREDEKVRNIKLNLKKKTKNSRKHIFLFSFGFFSFFFFFFFFFLRISYYRIASRLKGYKILWFLINALFSNCYKTKYHSSEQKNNSNILNEH